MGLRADYGVDPAKAAALIEGLIAAELDRQGCRRRASALCGSRLDQREVDAQGAVHRAAGRKALGAHMDASELEARLRRAVVEPRPALQ